MSEHKHVIKFDVKTYPCKCGLEFSQEFAETLVEAALSGSLPTVQLGIDLEFEKRKVAELKAFIAELEHDLTNKEIEYTDLWDDALAFQSRIAELEAEVTKCHELQDSYCDRIAELEAVIEILEDQRREVKNILIDKNLHIDSLYEEGYKLQQRIAELEAAQRWRVVADGELPEDRATILAAFKNREILTATYYKRYEGFGGVENYWHIEGWHSGDVTHWKPLPELPEVQE